MELTDLGPERMVVTAKPPPPVSIGLTNEALTSRQVAIGPAGRFEGGDCDKQV